MSKKIPLIILVGILGLLTAGTMWFLQGGTAAPMLGGVYMDEDAAVGKGFSAPSMGIMQGEMVGREPAVAMDMYTTSIDPMPPMYYPYDDALNVADRSVTKSSYHSVVVDEVEEYMRQMREYIKSIDGTVISYNQGTTENDYLYGSLSARIPEHQFEAANNKATENVRKVVNASIDEQDVTGQVVSVEEQLQKLNEQKSLKEIELDEANTEAERRRVQLEIDRIQRQIDQVTQSQQAVEETVKYASFNISASNREFYFNGQGPRPLSDVLREAWYSLRGTGYGLLYFLIWVAVYAIIWIPVLLLARWIWGKVRPAARKTTSR